MAAMTHKTISPSRLRAFTLIEMLAVIAILGILLTMIIGVSGYIKNRAKEKQTETTLKIVSEAVAYYQDNTGNLPRRYDSTGTLTVIADNDSTGLMYVLANSTYTKDLIAKLPKSAWGDEPDNVAIYDSNGSAVSSPGQCFLLVDAFGNEIHWYADQGRGGSFVLVSAGPDGNLNTDDDIRSDD